MSGPGVGIHLPVRRGRLRLAGDQNVVALLQGQLRPAVDRDSCVAMIGMSCEVGPTLSCVEGLAELAIRECELARRLRSGRGGGRFGLCRFGSRWSPSAVKAITLRFAAHATALRSISLASNASYVRSLCPSSVWKMRPVRTDRPRPAAHHGL